MSKENNRAKIRRLEKLGKKLQEQIVQTCDPEKPVVTAPTTKPGDREETEKTDESVKLLHHSLATGIELKKLMRGTPRVEYNLADRTLRQELRQDKDNLLNKAPELISKLSLIDLLTIYEEYKQDMCSKPSEQSYRMMRVETGTIMHCLFKTGNTETHAKFMEHLKERALTILSTANSDKWGPNTFALFDDLMHERRGRTENPYLKDGSCKARYYRALEPTMTN